MCGIAGVFCVGQSKDELTASARHMSDALEHRGPDDGGLWMDQEAGIALSHRRLAILDLSSEGQQPMVSASGRYILVFNGEIYNHLSIRKKLEAESLAPKWRGHSDTETILAALETWGLKQALEHCRGMFALGLWDRRTGTLFLSRDRMGEKPLYLAKTSGGWAFASELKALHNVDGFRAVLNREAISEFLVYGYVPDNLCIFQDVFKVPPGGVWQLRASSKTPELTMYYELSNDIASRSDSCSDNKGKNERSSVENVQNVLREVIGEQMLSDVPLGCFLSGGVDSSLVAALMQEQSCSSVLTFSIGFKESRFNEARNAAAVACHLKTEHTEFTLSENDALDLVNDLPKIYDEPFADSSQIPTVLLCGEARKSVTVALTGDGGDEMFGGYNRHISGPKMLNLLEKIPVHILRQGSRFVDLLGPSLIREDSWVRLVARKTNLPVTALDKLVSLSPTLAEVRNLHDLYQSFTRTIYDPNKLLSKPFCVENMPDPFPNLNGAEWIMAMDSVSYLPGDILVKVDRAAMENSLETRAPFLDARVVSEAWRLPLNMKIQSGIGKWVLRKILYQYVPQEIIDRPKQGFAIPLDQWLRGELRSWGEELLDQESLFRLVGVDRLAVSDLWDRHQNKAADVGSQLWNILTLLNWAKRYQSIICQ